MHTIRDFTRKPEGKYIYDKRKEAKRKYGDGKCEQHQYRPYNCIDNPDYETKEYGIQQIFHYKSWDNMRGSYHNYGGNDDSNKKK